MSKTLPLHDSPPALSLSQGYENYMNQITLVLSEGDELPTWKKHYLGSVCQVCCLWMCSPTRLTCLGNLLAFGWAWVSFEPIRWHFCCNLTLILWQRDRQETRQKEEQRKWQYMEIRTGCFELCELVCVWMCVADSGAAWRVSGNHTLFMSS